MSHHRDQASNRRSLSPMRAVAAAVIALAGIGSSSALALSPRAAPIDLVPHRAIYDLSLDSASTGSSISGMRGRMVHEFSGGPCEGYSVSMRWVAQMADGEGSVSIDDVRFASWEDAKGESYTYTSTRFLNDRKVEEVNAFAERGQTGSGKVKLTKPETATLPLPAGTIVPTEHLRAVISAARAGRVISEDRVYDVSEDGRQIYSTLAVVGSGVEKTRKELSRIAKIDRFDDIASWRVTISYFKGSEQGEPTPDFEQTFDLFANGIASDLRLNYGDIVIKGTLRNLELLSATPCR